VGHGSGVVARETIPKTPEPLRHWSPGLLSRRASGCCLTSGWHLSVQTFLWRNRNPRRLFDFLSARSVPGWQQTADHTWSHSMVGLRILSASARIGNWRATIIVRCTILRQSAARMGTLWEVRRTILRQSVTRMSTYETPPCGLLASGSVGMKRPGNMVSAAKDGLVEEFWQSTRSRGIAFLC